MSITFVYDGPDSPSDIDPYDDWHETEEALGERDETGAPVPGSQTAYDEPRDDIPGWERGIDPFEPEEPYDDASDPLVYDPDAPTRPDDDCPF